jgi:hypothetical protein
MPSATSAAVRRGQRDAYATADQSVRRKYAKPNAIDLEISPNGAVHLTIPLDDTDPTRLAELITAIQFQTGRSRPPSRPVTPGPSPRPRLQPSNACDAVNIKTNDSPNLNGPSIPFFHNNGKRCTDDDSGDDVSDDSSLRPAHSHRVTSAVESAISHAASDSVSSASNAQRMHRTVSQPSTRGPIPYCVAPAEEAAARQNGFIFPDKLPSRNANLGGLYPVPLIPVNSGYRDRPRSLTTYRTHDHGMSTSSLVPVPLSFVSAGNDTTPKNINDVDSNAVLADGKDSNSNSNRSEPEVSAIFREIAPCIGSNYLTADDMVIRSRLTPVHLAQNTCDESEPHDQPTATQTRTKEVPAGSLRDTTGPKDILMPVCATRQEILAGKHPGTARPTDIEEYTHGSCLIDEEAESAATFDVAHLNRTRQGLEDRDSSSSYLRSAQRSISSPDFNPYLSLRTCASPLNDFRPRTYSHTSSRISKDGRLRKHISRDQELDLAWYEVESVRNVPQTRVRPANKNRKTVFTRLNGLDPSNVDEPSSHARQRLVYTRRILSSLGASFTRRKSNIRAQISIAARAPEIVATDEINGTESFQAKCQDIEAVTPPLTSGFAGDPESLVSRSKISSPTGAISAAELDSAENAAWPNELLFEMNPDVKASAATSSRPKEVVSAGSLERVDKRKSLIGNPQSIGLPVTFVGPTASSSVVTRSGRMIGSWLEFTVKMAAELVITEIARIAREHGHDVWRRPGERKLRCTAQPEAHGPPMFISIYVASFSDGTGSRVRLRRARADRNLTEWWRFVSFHRTVMERFDNLVARAE